MSHRTNVSLNRRRRAARLGLLLVAVLYAGACGAAASTPSTAAPAKAAAGTSATTPTAAGTAPSTGSASAAAASKGAPAAPTGTKPAMGATAHASAATAHASAATSAGAGAGAGAGASGSTSPVTAPTATPAGAQPPAALAARRQPPSSEVDQVIATVSALVPGVTPTVAQVAAAGNQVCTAFDQGQTFDQVKSTALALAGGTVSASAAVADSAVRTLVGMYCPGYSSRLV